MSTDKELLDLKTKLASVSMLLAGAQANTAQLVTRARQAEEMLAMFQTGPQAAEVAQLIIRHMDQNHQTLAAHQLNLIQTTAVSLATALNGSDEELRALVNTVTKGLTRALETMTQIRLAENAEHVELRKANNPNLPTR